MRVSTVNVWCPNIDQAPGGMIPKDDVINDPSMLGPFILADIVTLTAFVGVAYDLNLQITIRKMF